MKIFFIYHVYGLHGSLGLLGFLQTNKIVSGTNWTNVKEKPTQQVLLVSPAVILMESKNQISLLHFPHLLKPL